MSSHPLAPLTMRTLLSLIIGWLPVAAAAAAIPLLPGPLSPQAVVLPAPPNAPPVGPSLVRLDVRVGGVSRDTAYLLPTDTVPVTVIARAVATNRLISSPAMKWWPAKAPCVTALAVTRPARTSGGLALVESGSVACGDFTGQSLGFSVYLNGVETEGRVIVARPDPLPFSPLAICLAAKPDVLRYVSHDSLVALAMQMASGKYVSVAWAESPDSTGHVGDGADRSTLIAWPWQAPGTRVSLAYRAILCTPGYGARDVTTSSRTHWSSADTSVARVSKGQVTWLRAEGFTLRAEYR